MPIKELREKAKNLGIAVKAGWRKVQIIKAIQRAEGNFDCFGTATEGFCDRFDCCFVGDCLDYGRK